MVHPAIPSDADRPNLLNGLVAKRAEIAGRLEANQQQHLRLTSDLKVIDEAIRLFEPDVDLAAVRAKPVRPPHAAASGEVTPAIFDALRTSDRPLTSAELARTIMQRRGLDLDDAALARIVRARVGACLAAKRRRGLVVSHPVQGRKIAWRLAERPLGRAIPVRGSRL